LHGLFAFQGPTKVEVILKTQDIREKIHLLPGKSRVELKDLLCVLCDPHGVPLLLNKF
jgi:hypothetical protein